MRANWLASVLCLAMVAPLASCTEVIEKSPELVEVEKSVGVCTSELEEGNYKAALLAAEKVIKDSRLASEDDVAVDQARFCYTTANSLYQLNELTTNLKALLEMALGLMGGSTLSLSPKEFAQLAMDYRDGKLDPQAASAISVVLGGFLGPIKTTLQENQEQLEFIIAEKRFKWYPRSIPVKIAGAEIMDAGGIYDLGEIYLLYGLTRSILSTFYMVESQDYSIDVNALLDYVMGVDEAKNPLMQLSDAPGKAIMNAVAVLMGTSPTFLALDRTNGIELMAEAGEGYSAGFDSVLKAVSHMKKRSGDQSLHVVEYKRDTVSGGQEEDLFIVHIKFNNSANPLPIVDLQKFDGLVIPLREDIIESLEHLRDDFAGNSGINTNLQRDIFPIVALVAVVLINSGAFDAIIDLAMSSADPAMKDQANKVLDIVGGNRDIVTGALVALVPVEMEFDFGAIYKKPGGLRDIFPAWTQPADETAMDPFTEATLVYSYECDDGKDPIRKVPEEYICDSVSTTSDKGHFQPANGAPFKYDYWNGAVYKLVTSGLTWTDYVSQNFGPKWDGSMDLGSSMSKDGISTVLPYIGFKDPTFGGLLYLDINTIKSEQLIPAKNGFEPASLKTLNATIATVVATVQGFLD